MIRRLAWHKVPSVPVLEALPRLAWRSPAEGRSAATETAALMVYVALVFMSQAPEWPLGGPQQADASYDELALATGLSRKMIAGGIARLKALDLLQATGSNQRRRYVIVSRPKPPTSAAPAQGSTQASPGGPLPAPDYDVVSSAVGAPLMRLAGPGPSPGTLSYVPDQEPAHPFFKLPCRKLVAGDVIVPFGNFLLRSKFELYALKLYLYLAARRNNSSYESLASHDKIHESTGIPRRDIRRAISTLINVGLFRAVDRRSSGVGVHEHSPNLYYLRGCEDLVRQQHAVEAVTAQSAAAQTGADLF